MSSKVVECMLSPRRLGDGVPLRRFNNLSIDSELGTMKVIHNNVRDLAIIFNETIA